MINSILMKRIHIISIGDYTMCQLAVALKKKGYHVTGSDIVIPEEQRKLLAQHDLLPERMDWDTEMLVKGIDVVVPAMHLDKSNPELARAYEKGLLVMSFPEFIYHQNKNKVRFVVSGSKGKSSIMSMMMFALKKHKIAFDYVALNEIKGTSSSIHLSYDNRIALLEGDEFSTSPIESRPLHLFYKPQIALLTNLIWEENPSFPTFESYLDSFKTLVERIDRDGKCIYFEEDMPLENLTALLRDDITGMPYKAHDTEYVDGQLMLKTRFGHYPIEVCDEYFLQNLNGARLACRQLGMQDKDFYAAISEYCTHFTKEPVSVEIRRDPA
jgi:UDP-N-acetylmuramate-alanine ligase